MIILPPYYPKNPDTKPVIFLAGPIQGAPSWHEKAIRRILKRGVDCHIACPKKGIVEEYNPRNCDMDNGPYSQYDWETSFLNKAADNGVILFWLAKEETHFCKRSYGQTTRYELAEWKERMIRGEATIVLGIEEGWTGERYIRHRLDRELPDLEVHSTLGGTVKEAVRILFPEAVEEVS